VPHPCGLVHAKVRLEFHFTEGESGAGDGNRNHARTAKLLNRLSGHYGLPSITVHNRSYPFDSFPVSISDNVSVNLQRRSCVGMLELPLDHLRRSPGIKKQRRVRMTECMETTPWNPECIKNGPQVILNNFVGRWRSAVPRGEEKTVAVWLPLRSICFEN
jgi:hypothetical protein